MTRFVRVRLCDEDCGFIEVGFGVGLLEGCEDHDWSGMGMGMGEGALGC